VWVTREGSGNIKKLEGFSHIGRQDKCTRGVLKAPEHPTTPSRGQPCRVANLSPKLTPLLHRSSPVDDGILLLLPRLLRRLRPGGIRSEPVPRAHHERHAALSTAASSNVVWPVLATWVEVVAHGREVHSSVVLPVLVSWSLVEVRGRAGHSSVVWPVFHSSVRWPVMDTCSVVVVRGRAGHSSVL
jgi:hypothetical protein